MNDELQRWAVGADVLSTPLEDEVVLLDKSGEMYSLKGVAQAAWLALPASVATLTRAVTQTFEVDEDQAQRDVVQFLAELEQLNLVEPEGP